MLASAFYAFSIAVAQACSTPPLLPAYAHNDYYNAHPLQDAVALGYQGVEADYVMVRGRLLVAHSRSEAQWARTLERLYLAPLRARIQRCGWVQAPGRPFLLNIESKEKRLAAYRALRELLRAYSDIIGTTARPGPVRVVLVGWHPPLGELAADSNPMVSVQARLTRSGLNLPKGDTALVGMVSLDYGGTMEWKGRGALSYRDRQMLAHLAAARRALPGRLVRAYNVPAITAVYQLLLKSNVDLIGARRPGETADILSRLDQEER